MPYSTDHSEVWVFLGTNVAFSLTRAAKTVKKYASHKTRPAACKTAKITPVGPKKGQTMKNYFFEKVRNFSILDERECQTAWLFAYLGPFGRQRRAWPHGSSYWPKGWVRVDSRRCGCWNSRAVGNPTRACVTRWLFGLFCDQ